mmetsp:Transcript_14574/g.34413  ORF Transcript_14574/g.34413 Transcript_14574/m.34413 type:complete len:242 (+) Transcript_14574:228-953(+)
MKIAKPVSRMKASPLCSLEMDISRPVPALEKATPPPTIRSLTRKSTGSKALTSSSSPPTADVFTLMSPTLMPRSLRSPGRCLQNAGASASPSVSSSTSVVTATLPPRSALSEAQKAAALDRSCALESLPLQCQMPSSLSRMKTSPELSELAVHWTCFTWMVRLPLRCSRRQMFSFSTLTKPLSMPPLRTSKVLKHCRNCSDSWSWHSRCCTGPPPRSSSSSTVLYAATPLSSLDVSAPSQK